MNIMCGDIFKLNKCSKWHQIEMKEMEMEIQNWRIYLLVEEFDGDFGTSSLEFPPIIGVELLDGWCVSG